MSNAIADHYAADDLLASIEAGMAALGKSPATVSVADLGPVDEFHVGGRSATTELCDRLDATSDSRLLDVGCGIGGTARFIASTVGSHVTGLDITPGYIDVARTLSEWTGLDDLNRFEVGSALDMPFDDHSFDAATQLHVGMNIADKAALFTEVYRVLRPGGSFAVYDIMRVGEQPFDFPVPWSSDETTSSVADVETYRDTLQSAGFELGAERNRREFAVEFFTAMRERTAQQGGPPPLGLHVIIGSDTPTKIANLVNALLAATLAPVEMICHKPAA
jgi:ubiquinone/menaquinone biosynthesis C-methylase UbiE